MFTILTVSAQVQISGNIAFNTTWTKALSPYKVVGDVQIPAGVKLTIEPGVEVIYAGDYELLVKGQLIANGTADDTIVFRSDVSGTRKGKRFLNFEGTNLAIHQMNYIRMVDGNIGIQVGNETEYVQGDKNTGTLKVGHLRFKNTDILTSGYETYAQLQLSDGDFEAGQIKGDYPRSEKITLNRFRIKNATLFSDSYNNGIWLDSCQVKNATLQIGCCGANLNFNRCTIEGGTFTPTNNYYSMTITNSKLINLPMDMSAAADVTIINSVITVGAGYGSCLLSCKTSPCRESRLMDRAQASRSN